MLYRSNLLLAHFHSPPAPPNSDIIPQDILNDTSLVALLLSNGDRALFFQDNTGLLRRAVRTYSNGQWITSPNLNASTNLSPGLSSNPKRYTPLTTIGPTCGQNVLAKLQRRTSILPFARTLTSTQISISLFYVSENNTVSSNVLVQNDSWIPNPMLGPDSRSYSTAVDTRSLSIKRIVNDSRLEMNSTTNCALLYYEDTSGKVSALLNRVSERPNPSSGLGLQFQWINVTSQESEALPPEFRNAPGYNYSKTFSHTLYESDPFTVYRTPFSSDGGLFYSPSNPVLSAASPLTGGSIFWTGYNIGTTGPGNFSQVGMHYVSSYWKPFREMTMELESKLPSGNLYSIHQSDIALFGSGVYGIWINGTQPALVTFSGLIPALPSNEFPFTRLASISTADMTTTYLYHQINGTTFAEEEWDDGLRAWSSTEYITVSDS